MSDLRVMSRDGAIHELTRELKLNSSQESAHYLDMILPEVIRHNLYHLSLSGGDGLHFVPVYTRTLTSAVRNQLEAVWPRLRQESAHSFSFDSTVDNPEPEDELAWQLKQLSVLGDIVNLGEGFWLPAPIRQVPLANSDDVAILGGASTRDLRHIWPGTRSAGYGRLVVQPAKDSREMAEEQPYDDWVGWRPDNVLSWVKHEMLQTIREGSISSGTFSDFEIYVSSWELRRVAPRAWLPAFGMHAGTKIEPVMLCRTRTLPHRYFLGHFSDSQLKRERSINTEHVRWMQLGVGLCHGLSPAASWRGHTAKLFPLPPLAVERHLLMYAYALRPEPGQFLYYVLPEFRSRVEELLSCVGYRNLSSGGAPN